MADLSTTDVQYIRGIGPQKAKGSAKAGHRPLRDLIAWLPRRYEDRTGFRKISTRPG